MSAFVDGDFSYPREIEGSGTRVFSQYYTGDFILSRLYVQEKNSYSPQAISTSDYQYKYAILVLEQEIKRDAYLVWFRREYATVPAARFEGRETLVTIPGTTGLSIGINGKITGWSKYGGSSPATVYRCATVETSYTIGEPGLNTPFQVTYGGQVVDYCGTVWTADGSKFLGVTNPNFSPATFVLSDVARRWKGNIWERETVSVTI